MKIFKAKMWTIDRYMWLATIIFLCIILVYQLLKNFSPYIENKDTVLVNKNYFALAIFSFTAVFTIIFVKHTMKSTKPLNTLLLFFIFLALIFSYINFGERSWKGSDVAYDLYGQSKIVNKVGILNYLANYNQYGAPSKEMQDNFIRCLKLCGIDGKIKYTFTDKTNIYSKQYHHFFSNPPLSHLICFFWMKIFGFSQGALNSLIILITFVSFIILYRLFCLLFEKSIAVWLSLVWISTPEVLRNIYPPCLETFLICFSLLSIYVFNFAERKKKDIFHFMVGLFLGLAIYTKFTAIPMALMFITIYLTNFIPRRFKPLLMFILGSLSVILVFFFLGYNPIYTLVTVTIVQLNYIHNTFITFIRYISFPLYLGLPTLALVFYALKNSIHLRKDKTKVFASNENLLYFAFFLIAYIIYYRTGAANRYIMPYFPFVLIILGRYIYEKGCHIDLRRYNYIFIYNFLLGILIEFL
jgi:hypothetical protein